MLQKNTRCIKSRGWKQRAVLNEKKKIFQQNKKNLDIFILFKSFHPRLFYDAGKLKNLQDLEDFSEEQSSV